MAQLIIDKIYKTLYTPEQLRIAQAGETWLLYIKLIQYMRLWDKTAFFIRLIQETIGDAMYFLLVYGVVIFSFAVALFMLNQNRGYGSDNSIYDELTGFETADAAIATYMQSLGDFSTDSYNSGDNPHMIWLFFIVTTFLTTITILNMLIAVMGDTFARETEIKERQILRERMIF